MLVFIALNQAFKTVKSARNDAPNMPIFQRLVLHWEMAAFLRRKVALAQKMHLSVDKILQSAL